jgi:hypothetical protein
MRQRGGLVGEPAPLTKNGAYLRRLTLAPNSKTAELRYPEAGEERAFLFGTPVVTDAG